MRKLIIIPLVLGLALLGAACNRDVYEADCLDNAERPAIVTAAPDGVRKWPGFTSLPTDTPIDARGKVFDGSREVGAKIHTVEGSRDNLCIVGGDFFTTLDPDNSSWSTIWHKRWGLVVNTPNTSIVGINLSNTGDGIMFEQSQAKNWSIVGVRADGGDTADGAYIHDDCIENDFMHAGQILDSKFDGCHVFLSTTMGNNPGTVQPDGSADTIEIADSLVRLQPMKNSYNPLKYGFYQTGGFFKSATPDAGDLLGDGTAPKFVIRDTMFRADQPAKYGGNENGPLGLPTGTECSNVTLVGWETWPTRDLSSWQQACGESLRLGTMDDWNAAVAQWDDVHPRL